MALYNRRQLAQMRVQDMRTRLQNPHITDNQRLYYRILGEISLVNVFYASFGDIDTTNYPPSHIFTIAAMYHRIIDLVGREKFDLIEAAGQLANINLDVTNNILSQ